MPIDIFAALGALVRAEAARTGKKSVPRPLTKAAHEHIDEPAPETPDRSTADRADARAATAARPPAARRHWLARVFRKLAAFFR
ncbi:hypothetical protein [Streptomyces chattanoogensis]|uniref:Uncharacterized protein n=1 Tax=Streptomyces chattanoogensis TaxID=66876 RepID=A0A0N0H0U7_9ACTN|nr:hypothetical protein [Streptomyces chattanoogensis]KPC63929.1 hypothetical protein ADL29_14820 [Streptomyces chattanoogensis]